MLAPLCGGAERQMPLSRYFLYVGAVLLALLFIADAWAPTLPQQGGASSAFVVIRIHSSEKWPDRIDLDTSQPPVAPGPPAVAAAASDPPIVAADIPARVQDAFALLPATEAVEGRVEKTAAKPRHVRKPAIRAAPPRIRLARQPRFDWFGFHTW